MQISTLNKYFYGLLSFGDFLKIIAPEVDEYRSLMEKGGSTIPLRLSEDEELIISNSNFVKLIQDFINYGGDTVGLSYICDSFTLGEKIEYNSDELLEIVFEIADPEINGDGAAWS